MRIVKRQHGIVLLVTLVVLIIMTLGALSIARSLDSTTMIAGNLAFRQSAIHSGDVGTETAISWLAGQGAAALNNDNAAEGYWSAALAIIPPGQDTWDKFWTDTLDARSKTLAQDAVGNTVKYVVDRLCAAAGPPSNCSFLPSTTSLEAAGKGESALILKGTPKAFYRITARIDGPRNTVSYIQINVAK